MRKNKIILLVITFMVSMAFGYFVTRLVRGNNEPVKNDDPVIIVEESQSNKVTNTTSVENTDTIADNHDVPVVSPDTFPAPPVKKRKPSATALTRIINDLNNRNYPRGVNLKYENLDREKGEQPQQSISNIRNYIQSGVWKSVTVTDFEYDEETGRITSITLRINRNIED